MSSAVLSIKQVAVHDVEPCSVNLDSETGKILVTDYHSNTGQNC